MPLVKNKVSVPFSAGLQTKTDELQTQLEGLQDLENVIFETPNKLRKRRGYNLQSIKQLDNSEITDARFLANYGDELGLMTSNDYFAFSQSIDKWINKGQVFSAFPKSDTILRNDKEQKNLDVVNIENVNCYTFQDSTGVRISLIDSINMNFLASNVLISASGTVPRAAKIQNVFYVFYADGTDIKYKKINILEPTNISAEFTAISTLEATDNKFDVVTIADKIFIAYNSSDTGGVLQLINLDSGDTISSVVSFSGQDASDALSITTDASSRAVITYSTGSEVKIAVQSANLAAEILAPSVIESIANVTNVTTTQIDPTSGDYDVFYEISAASVKDHYVRKNTINIDSTLGTAATIKRSVGLASKAFTLNNESYVNVIHESALQSSYFTLNSNGTIVSRFSPNLGGDLITENVLTNVENIGDSKFLLASQIKGRTVVDNDQFFSLLGVNETILDFDIEFPFQNERSGDNLHITGGILKSYDGAVITEHGFHLFPEDLSNAGTSAVGGSIGDGIYQYAAVYAWTDNRGLIHRSAPSIGFEVTLSGGTNTQQQSITVPTLRLTQKQDAIIELYRTEAAGTIFYKVTEVSSPILNDPTIDSITILDTTNDTNLIDNEVLYTTGGVLDNIPAPSSSIIESFSSRIFLAGLEDSNKLQFSKIRFEGAPIEFNDTLTIQVSGKGGNITALRAMDDKLLIFKETAIFYLSGDGPNNIGQQDTFISPELVSSDIGCINPNSTVLTPIGTMFKSSKGIYLLTRGMQLTYIGDNVEKFNNLTVTSAIVVPEENEVRFTTSDGPALVYNYFVNQWNTFSNHRGLSAVNIDFTYYYLRDDRTLFVEDENSFTDNGSPVNIKLETNWISFAGVQGFQRIYKLLLLGEFKSPHKLRIRIAYDFNDAFVQEVIIDTADFTDNTRYGEYSPYGDPSTVPYGGDGNVHQLRVDLKRQKCQSIKIRIEEIQNDLQNLGEGLSLSNIMLEVGQKVGVNKIDTGRQYGTT